MCTLHFISRRFYLAWEGGNAYCEAHNGGVAHGDAAGVVAQKVHVRDGLNDQANDGKCIEKLRTRARQRSGRKRRAQVHGRTVLGRLKVGLAPPPAVRGEHVAVRTRSGNCSRQDRVRQVEIQLHCWRALPKKNEYPKY